MIRSNYTKAVFGESRPQVLHERAPPTAGVAREPPSLRLHDAAELRPPGHVRQHRRVPGDLAPVEQRPLIPYPDQAELHHGRGKVVVVFHDADGDLLRGLADLWEGRGEGVGMKQRRRYER